MARDIDLLDQGTLQVRFYEHTGKCPVDGILPVPIDSLQVAGIPSLAGDLSIAKPGGGAQHGQENGGQKQDRKTVFFHQYLIPISSSLQVVGACAAAVVFPVAAPGPGVNHRLPGPSR